MIAAQNFISLIVKREALERFEKGLSQKLIEKYNLDKVYYDENLLALPGAMNPYDMEDVVKEYTQKYNLKFLDENKKAVDFVVIDAFLGPTAECDWLSSNTKKDYYLLEGKKVSSNRVYFFKSNALSSDENKRLKQLLDLPLNYLTVEDYNILPFNWLIKYAKKHNYNIENLFEIFKPDFYENSEKNFIFDMKKEIETTQKISISFLQRHLSCGYKKAVSCINDLLENNIIEKQNNFYKVLKVKDLKDFINKNKNQLIW